MQITPYQLDALKKRERRQAESGVARSLPRKKAPKASKRKIVQAAG